MKIKRDQNLAKLDSDSVPFSPLLPDMDLKHIARMTTKILMSYLTYQAVHVVIDQLKETDPPRSLWLHQFSTQERIQDGELYLADLMQERKELAMRIMTVRAHLADEISDFLPEMLTSSVQQANAEHRRAYLERLTQLDADTAIDDVTNPSNSKEFSDADPT